MTKVEARYEALVLMKSFQPLGMADVTEMKGGKGFEKVLWMFGFLDNMKSCAFLPQCAAMVRMMQAGSMEIYMVAASCLETAKLLIGRGGALVSDPKHADLTKIRDAFMSMNKDQMKCAISSGALIFFARLEPGQVIYIPQGFLVLEAVVQGPLAFGVRKSFFELSPEPDTMANFELSGALLKANGSSSSDKHVEVLEFLNNLKAT